MQVKSIWSGAHKIDLTHWGQGKIATISKTTFLNAFLNENIWISLAIWLKFVPKVRINNIPALVQVMACRLVGAKPLPEPMLEYC